MSSPILVTPPVVRVVAEFGETCSIAEFGEM